MTYVINTNCHLNAICHLKTIKAAVRDDLQFRQLLNDQHFIGTISELDNNTVFLKSICQN